MVRSAFSSPPESFGPVRGKFVLEPAQLQVSRDQPQVLGHFEGINGSDVSLPPDNRFDRLGYGPYAPKVEAGEE